MRRASLVLALMGCGTGVVIGLPQKKTKPGMHVPYIVGDPVPNPPIRAALARTPWLPVHTSPPALTGHYVRRADNSALYDQLRREVWGLKHPRVELDEIDPNELEQLRIRPPTTHVWLIGPEGPCRATLGQPRVAAHPTVGGVIEVRYDLEGCVPAAWAPVGSLVEQMPADVRWEPAEMVTEVDLPPAQQWDHPFANAVPWPDESERAADRMNVVARAVRGLDPVPGQTLITAVWTHPDDACLDAETTVVGHVLSGQGGVEVQDPLPGLDTVPELLGAVVQENHPEALVYSDRVDLFVAVPPASPEDRPDLPPEVDRGPQTWTQFTVDLGPSTDAELDEATYRILPPC